MMVVNVKSIRNRKKQTLKDKINDIIQQFAPPNYILIMFPIWIHFPYWILVIMLRSDSSIHEF